MKRIKMRFSWLIVPAFVWLLCSPMIAVETQAAELAELHQTLQSESELFAKAKACQELAVVGTAESVELLTPLINHPQLSGYALSALVRIPDTEAETALIDSLPRLDGNALSGVLHALGQRESKPAVAPIAKLLSSGKLEIAQHQSALIALGTIATPEARQALVAFQSTNQPSVIQRAHADALLAVGVRQATGDLLSKKRSEFQRGLAAARASGKAGAQSLVEALPKLPSQRQTLALIALADLAEPSGIESAQKLIEAADPAVSVRAVEAVSAMGGFANTKTLPKFLVARPELAIRYSPALANANNASIDAAVTGLLNESVIASDVSVQLQLACIDYASRRRLSAATPALLKLTNANDNAISEAALQALAFCVDSAQLPNLINRLENGVDPNVSTAILKNACVHLPQEGATVAFKTAITESNGAWRSTLVSQLAFLGGPTALNVVVNLAATGNEADLDAATRVLGEWTTADVSVPLLKLADELPQGKYQLRALRGYLRVGRQLEMSPEDRFDLCRNGWERAERDDERQLVTEIIRRFPSRPALSWLANLMKRDSALSKAVRNKAYVALNQAAQRIALDDAQFVKLQLRDLDLDKAPASVRDSLNQLR